MSQPEDFSEAASSSKDTGDRSLGVQMGPIAGTSQPRPAEPMHSASRATGVPRDISIGTPFQNAAAEGVEAGSNVAWIPGGGSPKSLLQLRGTVDSMTDNEGGSASRRSVRLARGAWSASDQPGSSPTKAGGGSLGNLRQVRTEPAGKSPPRDFQSSLARNVSAEGLRRSSPGGSGDTPLGGARSTAIRKASSSSQLASTASLLRGRLDSSDVELGPMIGRGSFGRVYKGEICCWSCPIQVVSKLGQLCDRPTWVV